MKEKSILEQALLQMETLEEAVKKNAKGIIASSMKQELSDLLKETMEEEELPNEEDEVTPDEETTDEIPADETTGDETGLDNDTTDDTLDTDTEEIPDEEPDMDADDFSSEGEDEEDVVDMTNASDEEILTVFKKMGDEDGIIVKKDGNNIEFSDGNGEYLIKLDSDAGIDAGLDGIEGDELPELPVDAGIGDETGIGAEDGIEDTEEFSDDETDVEDETSDEEEMFEGDETIYEIELGEEDEKEEDKEEKEEDVDEAARTKWNPHGNKGGANRAGIPSKKLFKAGSTINEEYNKIKLQNEEYKKALILFKEKLNEVAVFNANLALANRLFIEHSTSRQEKLNILKRFDTISTLKESKNLYNTIKTELGTKKPISESVVEKIITTPSSSSSKSTEILSEAKAYENPQFKRMKELMGKIN